MTKTQAVFFDLDGTLVDTAPDLAHALNATLITENKTPLTLDKIRPHVSQGGIALTRLGFPEVLDEVTFEALRQKLLDHYLHSICKDTVLFEGMDELIDQLEQANLPWGIVTNKPMWLTEPLLKALNIDHRSCCTVGGDSLAKRKPHPDPLLHACKLTKVEPEQCIYLGDDPRDIHAGNAAGMYTYVARYGYLGAEDQPELWGADGVSDTPLELLDLIRT